MKSYVVFSTPGLIDLRAFTVFGVNSKPNSSSPIGTFGTGLKYAIAVLLRTDPKREITLWRGMERYTFNQNEDEFREDSFTFLEIRRDKKVFFSKTPLPFTTDLGKKWELWQAFRELYANTLDEDGTTWIHDQPSTLQGIRDMTQIIIGGDDFVQEFHDREKTFLPDALMKRDGTEAVQRFDKPSQHVYYRGFRVHDLQKPSQYTYNILKEIDLTEDRTAKYGWQIDQAISQYIVQYTDKQFIQTSVSAPDTSYEGSLDLGSSWVTPSKEFLDAMEEIDRKIAVSQSARRLFTTYRPAPPVVRKPENLVDDFIDALDNGDYGLMQDLTEDREARNRILEVLKAGQNVVEMAETYDGKPFEDGEDEKGMDAVEDSFATKDEIPF